jgi:hypothetical protein
MTCLNRWLLFPLILALLPQPFPDKLKNGVCSEPLTSIKLPYNSAVSKVARKHSCLQSISNSTAVHEQTIEVMPVTQVLNYPTPAAEGKGKDALWFK